MTQPNLKPDEIVMLERAEKATKGPWTQDDNGTLVRDADHCICEASPRAAYSYGMTSCGANTRFIAAARTDLPTILTRHANERAKLAEAIREIEKAATELRRDLPPQYAGVDREGLPIEVEHSSAEMTCGMVAMSLDAALRRINELEKQS